MHNRVLSLVVCGWVAVAALPVFAAERTLIRDVNVLPMTSEAVQGHQDVTIDGSRIAAIQAHDPDRSTKRFDRIIDGSGKYLIPGFCDLHVHIKGRRDEFADALYLYPALGVTTVLNMNGNRQVLRLREQIESGEMFGPRIVTTTPIMGNISPTPDTEDRAREIVRGYAAEGYDFIKVYNMIPEPGYRGIIDEAKNVGIPVVGHAVRSVGIEGAIATGQDLAHMEELIYGYFGNDLDESKIRPLAKEMKAAGVDVIATLVVYHNIIRQLEDIDAMLASPGIEYMPMSTRRTFYPPENPYLQSFDEERLENQLRPHFAFLQMLTRVLHEEGVRILAGTDATVEIVVPGYSLHDELQELVDAGLTPYAALRAATADAAAFLGGADDYGTIETGKTADAILLSGNPLDDIANTRRIDGVFVRGNYHSPDDIAAHLTEIEARVNASAD